MKNNINLKKPVAVISVIAVLFFLAAGCKAPSESKPAFDLTKAKMEIEDANQNFMTLVSKGDTIALTNCYTVDAKFLGPNSPAISGKKNIQATVAGLIKAGIGKLELKALDVWGNEEMLTEEGQVKMFTKEGQQIDQGKYIVVWKKEDNKWKIFRDMFNSDMPVPAAK